MLVAPQDLHQGQEQSIHFVQLLCIRQLIIEQMNLLHFT